MDNGIIWAYLFLSTNCFLYTPENGGPGVLQGSRAVPRGVGVGPLVHFVGSYICMYDEERLWE
jgi:hypothetical protein